MNSRNFDLLVHSNQVWGNRFPTQFHPFHRNPSICRHKVCHLMAIRISWESYVFNCYAPTWFSIPILAWFSSVQFPDVKESPWVFAWPIAVTGFGEKLRLADMASLLLVHQVTDKTTNNIAIHFWGLWFLCLCFLDCLPPCSELEGQSWRFMLASEVHEICFPERRSVFYVSGLSCSLQVLSSLFGNVQGNEKYCVIRNLRIFLNFFNL